MPPRRFDPPTSSRCLLRGARFVALTVTVLSCTDTVEPDPETLTLTLLSEPFHIGTVGSGLSTLISFAYFALESGMQRGGQFEVEIVSGNGTVSWEGSNSMTSASGNGIVMSFQDPVAPVLVSWQLGTAAGSNAIRFRPARPEATVSTLTVFAFAEPGPVAIVTKSADGQFGTPDQTLSAPIGLRLADRYNNAVSGVEITWAVTSGGGVLIGDEAETDEGGLVRRGWTLGLTLGEQTATATVAGVGVFRFSAWAQ